MSEENTKDNELKFYFHWNEGNYLFRTRHYREAIEAYTRALQLKSDDTGCLEKRSECHLILSHHKEALEDARAALQANSESICGMRLMAEALYATAEFERALVIFHQGARKRPTMKAFQLGVKKAREAINNAIGHKSGLRFCPVKDFIKHMKDRTANEKSDLYTMEDQLRQHNNRESEIMLGKMSLDKQFLEHLVKHPQLSGDCGEMIKDEARETLELLKSDQEFWTKQRPLYAIKFQNKLISGRTTLYKEETKQINKARDEKKKIEENNRMANQRLEEIDICLRNDQLDEAMEKCDDLQDLLENSLKNLPNRDKHMSTVYSVKGEICRRENEYSNALKWHHKDLELSKKNNGDYGHALENIGLTHITFDQNAEAIEVLQERVILCTKKLDKVRLYLQIGHACKQLGLLEKARFYASQSMDVNGEPCLSVDYQLRALALLAYVEAQQDSLAACLNHFDKAIQLAEQHGMVREMAAVERAREQQVTMMAERRNQQERQREQYALLAQPKPKKHVGPLRFKTTVDEIENTREESLKVDLNEDSVQASNKKASGTESIAAGRSLISDQSQTQKSIESMMEYMAWSDEDQETDDTQEEENTESEEGEETDENKVTLERRGSDEKQETIQSTENESQLPTTEEIANTKSDNETTDDVTDGGYYTSQTAVTTDNEVQPASDSDTANNVAQYGGNGQDEDSEGQETNQTAESASDATPQFNVTSDDETDQAQS